MNKKNYNKTFVYVFATISFLTIVFSFSSTVSAAGEEFITTWKTDNVGLSNSTSITIPTYPGETYNYDVDWNNDGTFDQFAITGSVTHNFGVAGTYTIRIQGTFPRIYFYNAGDRQKILSVNQWGNTAWSSMGSAFRSCYNLSILATDNPILTNVTDMSHMFDSATSFNQNIDSWNVSNVIDMSYLFYNATSFNQPLNSWVVSNVMDMNNMFYNAISFNQNINNWDVSSVTNMNHMFMRSNSFNQNIGNWNVSNVTNMAYMFQEISFNQNIGNWNVSNVTDMSYMFYNNRFFNQDIGNWNVSKVISMSYMFGFATSFNQYIGGWDTSGLIQAVGMLSNATSFNQNISNWNVSKLVNASYMFYRAGDFNQDISAWNISSVNNMTYIFGDITLSTANYDSILNSWASLPVLINSVSFNGGNSQYCNAIISRQHLIDNHSWFIVDGGLDISCTSAPIIITTSSSSVTQNQATINGTITNTGNSEITIRGFEYWIEGETPPTTIQESGSFETGEFSALISSLTCGTTYNFLSYATNSIDTSYGEELTFTTSNCDTGGEIITDLDIIIISNEGDFSNLNLFNFKTISENGNYIVFTSENNETQDFGIYLYDRAGNTIDRITEIPESEVGQEILATISDNGRYVAIISGNIGFADGASVFLYDKSTGQTELIATEEEIPLLAGMFGVLSISNNGDVVISSNFYYSMMGLFILMRQDELPPDFAIPAIYFYNNSNSNISIIDQLNTDDIISPYGAYITADGAEIIYNNVKLIFNPDPEIDPQMIGGYFVYNVLNEESEENILNLNIDVQVFLSSSNSNNGRYLSFLAADVFSSGELSEESTFLVVYDRQLNQTETVPVYDFLTDTLVLESETRLIYNSTDVSDDGRYLLFSFSSLIKYLGGNSELNAVYPLFIYDTTKDESLILNDGNSYMSASISSDGKYVTFSSPDQLTDDDNDDLFDVFVMVNPLFEEAEEEREQPSGQSSGRRTGSSRVLLERFKQQQIERAIEAGIENYVSDYCVNVPALQTVIPEGWVTNDKYECFFGEIPPELIPAKIPEPISPNQPTSLPPKKIIPVPAVEENPIITISDEPRVVDDPKVIPPSIPMEKDNIFERFINFLQGLTGKIVINTIAGIGIISGLSLGVFNSLFINPISFSEIPLIPLRFWNFIMLFFGFRKKTRPWGTVYDSVTKQPLDPVYVTILDLNENEIASSITDLDGRYGFLVPPGQYRIMAGKANYEFPSKKLLGQTNDIIYQDLYFNEIIDIKEGGVVTKNIPMDPLVFDWNEFTKKDKNLMKFFSKKDLWITRISNWLFTIGLIFSVIMFLSSKSTTNTIILIIYIILLVLKNYILKPKPLGQITDKAGVPLAYAILRIFRKGGESEVIHKVTNKIGKYYCLIPNGNYFAKIENKNMDESYSLVYTSEVFEVKKGYVHNTFKI